METWVELDMGVKFSRLFIGCGSFFFYLRNGYNELYFRKYFYGGGISSVWRLEKRGYICLGRWRL